MKKFEYIFQNGAHKWAVIARDPDKPNYLIDTNEYLVINGDKAILTDPGGSEIFPEVFSTISAYYNPLNIESIFSSHQDPDIISSLALWLETNEKLKCYISWLWMSFVPHFGGNASTFIRIEDGGLDIRLGDLQLKIIPAHYLHSSGNFNLYDPAAGILFSGDVGAALLPESYTGIYVEDFENYTQYMKGFHQRWMPSNKAKEAWCERISSLNPNMIAPQHGSIFRGDDVKRFIDWFSRLEVGITQEPVTKNNS